MTVSVKLNDGETESYNYVKIKVSGWIVCYDDIGDEKIAYPPHKVIGVRDPVPEDQNRHEGLSTQSPHGRI